jgi:hypothetical protein
VPIEHVAVPVVAAVAEGFAAGSEKDTSLTN